MCKPISGRDNITVMLSILFICLVSCFWASGRASLFNVVIKFISTISMIVCIYRLCTVFKWYSYIKSFFQMCGKESLVIYVIQWSFVNFTPPNIKYMQVSNELLFILPVATFSIIICFVCYYIHTYVKKVPFVNQLLFGR